MQLLGYESPRVNAVTVKHAGQELQLRELRDINTVFPSKKTESHNALGHPNARVPNKSAFT